MKPGRYLVIKKFPFKALAKAMEPGMVIELKTQQATENIHKFWVNHYGYLNFERPWTYMKKLDESKNK